MTDADLRALLTVPANSDDAGFRLKVVERICLRQQRIASGRRLLAAVAIYGFPGITCGLLGQSVEGRLLIEPLALSVVLCLTAGEIATWFIRGRSLLGGQFF